MAKYETIKNVIIEKRASKSSFVVNHRSYTSAVSEIEPFAKKNGYELDPTGDPEMKGDQLAREIGMGPPKPKHGRTNKFNLFLYKGTKEQKKLLHVQIYGDEGRFELNMYIS